MKRLKRIEENKAVLKSLNIIQVHILRVYTLTKVCLARPKKSFMNFKGARLTLAPHQGDPFIHSVLTCNVYILVA